MKQYILSIFLMLFSVSCSKALTESSAVGIIQKSIDAKDNGMTTTSVIALTSLISEQPLRLQQTSIQRLVKEGYLEEKTVQVSYPNFSGHFTSHRGFPPGQQYGGWIDDLQIAVSPGHPPLANGTFRTCQAYDPNLFFAHDSCVSGNLNGPVQRSANSQFGVTVNSIGGSSLDLNSVITLRVSLVRGNPDIIQGTLQAPNNPLFGTPAPQPIRLEGHVAGEDISQEVYVYSWTNKLPKDMIVGGSLRLGNLVVDSCEHLLLSTETAATATCKTHVKLSKEAAAIFGETSTERPLQASFGKQPNATWVGTDFRYTPPTYIFQQ